MTQLTTRQAAANALLAGPATGSVAAQVTTPASGDQTVQRVVELATASIPNATMTGITMLVEEQPTTAFFSDPEVADIDQAQYRDDGPCLHAFRTGEPVRIDSLVDERRWREFCRRALDHGLRSTLSLPLIAHQRDAVGALNFYSPRLRGFDADDQHTAALFAQHAAVVLANARAYWGRPGSRGEDRRGAGVLEHVGQKQ